MKMYFLLKMVIFQPAMLVYQRVSVWSLFFWMLVRDIPMSSLEPSEDCNVMHRLEVRKPMIAAVGGRRIWGVGNSNREVG